MGIKIWVDDVRPAPKGYRWYKSVNEAITAIQNYKIMFNASGGKEYYRIALIDLDHDAGDFAKNGGDYIKVLDWLETVEYDGAIRLHTMNPVGRANMETIVRKNGWKQIF